jgi:pimeloyl-ACP methyl ester carboxylesterase
VEATRANADAVADHGIDEVAAHYATYMATLPSRRPIVVGHSFGGLLAEKLLGDGHAIAGLGSTPRRSRECSRCRLGAEGREPRQHRRRGVADQGAVPVRVRQRNQRGRVRRAVRQMGDLLAGTPLIPGGRRQRQPARADEGRHQESGTADRCCSPWRQGPHGPGDQAASRLFDLAPRLNS